MFSSLLSKPIHSEYFKPSALTSARKPGKVLLNRQDTKVSQTPNEPDKSDKGTVVELSSDGHNTVSKFHLNPDGSINYNLTVLSADSDRKFHTSHEDTIPLKKRYPNLKHHFPKYTLQNCPDDSIKTCVDETKKVINNLLQEKLGAATAKDDTTVVNYTSSNVIDNEEERGRTTQIQIKNYQQDPMLPPKHKLRKNRPTEPSPPPPILKSNNSEKLSKEEQDKWKIPSVISNWQNNQGFTISLEKRMLAATSNETPEVNLNKLADLSSALESADKQAREDIKARNELRQQQVEQQQREKELKLQELAELSKSQRHKRKNEYDDRYSKKRSTR